MESTPNADILQQHKQRQTHQSSGISLVKNDTYCISFEESQLLGAFSGNGNSTIHNS